MTEPRSDGPTPNIRTDLPGPKAARLIATDEQFTIADEIWVADQIRVLDAAQGVSTTERNRLTRQWRSSLVAKLHSTQVKLVALRELDRVRNENPVRKTLDC